MLILTFKYYKSFHLDFWQGLLIIFLNFKNIINYFSLIKLNAFIIWTSDVKYIIVLIFKFIDFFWAHFRQTTMNKFYYFPYLYSIFVSPPTFYTVLYLQCHFFFTNDRSYNCCVWSKKKIILNMNSVLYRDTETTDERE